MDPKVTPLQNKVCLSCGSPLQEKFCGYCGEKVLDPKELSLGYYLANLINAFTFAEGKLIKTIRALLTSPGRLSLDWVSGRRVKWMRPVSLFFLLNFIYFLYPMFETFNTKYVHQMNGQFYSSWLSPLGEAKQSKSELSKQDFEDLYNEQSSSNAKLLIVVFVFFKSLGLTLVFLFSKRTYVEHLTFAFEWSSFNLLINTILLSLISLLLYHFSQWIQTDVHSWMTDGRLALIVVFTNLLFLHAAGKHFYNLSLVQHLGFLFSSVLVLISSLAMYRVVLFLYTLYFM